MRAGLVQKTLIFGPVRVVHAVWKNEARKWEHTAHLRFSIVHGTPDQRIRALCVDADIYLCNYEGMAWLSQKLQQFYISQNKPLPFQMVVYDEVSRVKNSTSKRIKGSSRIFNKGKSNEHKEIYPGWRKMIPHFAFRTGLTGTPASNGYPDLHGQYLCVDGGQRLSPFVTHFREAYLTSDYMGWSHEVTPIGRTCIEKKIADITIEMSTRDYLDLPEIIFNDIEIDLPPAVRKNYEEVEKELFTKLDDGTEIELFNKTSVSNKCLQFANGSPYVEPNNPKWVELHDEKYQVLDSIIEEAAGNPVAVSYVYRADALRMMDRYKHLNPVNVSGMSPKHTQKIIDDWRQGKTKLLIGHPACVHPRTKVLTKRRGWVKIVDVKLSDEIYDGIEFVSHDGCSYSGCKEVIDVFGILMTLTHKLLIADKWEEALDVRNCEDIREKALYQYKGDDKYLSEMFTLRKNITSTPSECNKTQSSQKKILHSLYSRYFSQYDQHTNMENLARNEKSDKGYVRQKLCRTRDIIVRGMEKFQNLLQRYALDIQRRFDHRTYKCEQRVLQRKLRVGDSFSTTVQQTNNSKIGLPGYENSSCRAMQTDKHKQDDVNHEIESRDDGRPSGRGCERIPIQKKYETCECIASGKKKNDVYDLVNCGPRHRFLIRNDAGDVFISHNSMGHGLDGLQDNGDIVVWFGLTWNLEYYEQMNNRFMRQGRTRPLTIHRILATDTMDMAVKYSLEMKDQSQTGLKKSIRKYRAEKESQGNPNFM